MVVPMASESKARKTLMGPYFSAICKEEAGNICGGATDDVLCDCTIITDGGDGYRLDSRIIERRCPELIPAMQFDEATQRYSIYTPVTIDIVKETFHALMYDSTEVEDFLQLERILKVAHDWKLESVVRCVIRKFIAGMNEENCVGIWRICAKFLPDEMKKVFEYLLYTVNAEVSSGGNVDFFRLSHDNVFEILSADLLNVNDEMDVWILLKKWILADRRKRIPFYRYLLKSIRYSLLTNEQKDEMKKDLLRLKIDITDGKTVHWSTKTSPRIQRDLLVAIGGWEKSGPSNIVEVLNVNNNKWQRVRALEDERQVAYHECLVIDKKLYVLGGFEGSQYFNTVRCYDGETKKWCELAPMHYARCYISACEINGTIIVAGGSDGRSRLRTAEVYDAQKNQWTKIRSMLQRRSDAAACSMGGKMYIAGGYNGEAVLQTVEMYTPETDFWTEIAHMNSPRSGLACVADTDFMLIAGGFDGVNRLNSVEKLRFGSAHTVSIESMPTPRSNFAMCKMGKYFYAIGGYNTSVISSGARYDGEKWEKICDITVPRSALCVVLLKAWPDPANLLCDAATATSQSKEESTENSTEAPKSSKNKNFEAAMNYDLD